MAVQKWLSISVPLQGLLLLSQLVTGLNAYRIPIDLYPVIHRGGGILLVTLVIVRVAINWDWVGKTYRKRKST